MGNESSCCAYRNKKMSEFPVEGGENMHTAMENFQKKNLVTGRTHHVTHHPQVTTTSSQMLTTNQSQHQSSSSTSTSTSSSSSSSSRVAKSSQRILTSSSSSEMKASSMKSDLTELKRGISEMKNISTNFSQRLRSSMENLVDRDGSGPEETDLTEPLVTFPDTDTPPPVNDAVTLAGGSPSQLSSLNSLNNLHHSMSPPMNIPNMPNLPAGQETMKFEQKKMTSASKTKLGFTERMVAFDRRYTLRTSKML
ncbi:uncharacterized serine-rich protein C215.13-like [Mycetomoellerius zeteki]|uniref:uncharacterized serine-rich protein C215.13-like n=1 Tax=Mycetomoellerius zeteki TaxID=64791 RepID=UPI00084EB489|nr:PREDICTED: uncharacterized serine-rich protein C215.13-like [Trachymyrmex zeteki]